MSLSPLKFCVAPDKFKGSLSSAEAAEAIRAGLLRAIPNASVTILPLADGGEGTQAAFLSAVRSEAITCQSIDPLQRTIDVHYVRLLDEPVAVIEASEATGLARLAPGECNPLHTSTFGTGLMLSHAVENGAATVLVGLGGSSTNDAGCGIAHAFGWRFLDGAGKDVFPIPLNFPKITRVVPPASMPTAKFIGLADVANPLLGPRGCSRVYAAQKGANETDIELLETHLTHLADVITASIGTDYRNQPGAGAAGGLGYGLMTFLGGTLQSGFDTIATYTGLENALRQCDFVITGEGLLDQQSLEGKGPVALARLAHSLGKPVVALAGSVASGVDFSSTFEAVFSIVNRPMPLEEAMLNTARLLEQSAENVGNLIAISRTG